MTGLKERKRKEKKKVVRTQPKKKIKIKSIANIFVKSLAKKGIYVKGFK